MDMKRGRDRGSSQQGQVTVFIIAGIIIVFAFAAVLYFTQTTVRETLTTAGEPIIAAVPQEFAPLQAYTDDCLTQLGERGLYTLGQQGGYIYPEVLGEYSETDPTESDGLVLAPLKVPYWHYNAEPNEANKVVFSSYQPKLYAQEDPELSIESQLSRFVEEKLDACLNNYAPFAQEGFTIEMSPIREVQARVGEASVNFLLNMDVTVQKGDAKTTLNQFYVKIPLRLKHYYDVAAQITQAEQQYNYLERQGMELISVYSAIDPQYFPPTSDVTYELFSPYSWQETALQQKFTELLTSYVPMLRFLGSENFYYTTFPDNLLAQKIADNMVLPLTGAEDVSVNFDYFGWEPYFQTNSEDGVIKPEHMFIKFSVLSFGQQRYETHYDASYPVLVTIADDTALGGKGYALTFALESNIRNNQPASPAVIRDPYPLSVSSLACDEAQRTIGPLKTVVVDSFTKEPIELVKIGFTIPEQAECDIGLTDEHGEVESTYPSVYGGVLNFVHTDYLTNFYPIDTVKHQEDTVLGYAVAGIEEPEKVIELDRLKTISVSVKKKEVKKCVTPLECKYTKGIPFFKDISCAKGVPQCFFNDGQSLLGFTDPVIELVANGSLSRYHNYYFINNAKDLAENEEVTIQLERVQGFHDEIIGEEFFAPISVQGTQPAEVQLVPGVYKVSALSLRKEPLLIPSEERCFKFDILTWESQECFTVDESSLENGYVTGNLEWDTPETYITITPEQLYTSQKITLYIATQDLTSVPEKISATSKECVGYKIIPGIGSSFEGCDSKDISVSGRVIEDLQVPGELVNLTRQASIYEALQPSFS